MDRIVTGTERVEVKVIGGWAPVKVTAEARHTRPEVMAREEQADRTTVNACSSALRDTHDMTTVAAVIELFPDLLTERANNNRLEKGQGQMQLNKKSIVREERE
jgi:hypothetical protein